MDTYSHVLPGMQEESAARLNELLTTPEPHYTQAIRHITGDSWFFAGFGEDLPESESWIPGIQGG